MHKGDSRIIRAWTMYDWANSSYSLTISSAIFPIFYGVLTMKGGTDIVMEAHGIPAQTAYSWALSAGFLVVEFEKRAYVRKTISRITKRCNG